MCSWGHVAKNSTACSHEWRAHSTVALVFSTIAWHGQKKVIFWPWPQMSGGRGTKRHQHRVGELRAGPQALPPFGPSYWTTVLCLNTCREMSHGNSQVSVMTSCVLFCSPAASMLVPSSLHLHAAMAFHACVELQLSLYDTKAASGSTWLEPWII